MRTYQTQIGTLTVDYNPTTKYHEIVYSGNVIGKFTVESAAYKRAADIKKEFDNIPNIEERLNNAKREIEEVCKKYNVCLTDGFNEDDPYVAIYWKTDKRNSLTGRSMSIKTPMVIEKTIFGKKL